ncbi:hypothetical protein BC832DRAFT_601340, partial [Gaertneriomyces semiglobifer]
WPARPVVPRRNSRPPTTLRHCSLNDCQTWNPTPCASRTYAASNRLFVTAFAIELPLTSRPLTSYKLSPWNWIHPCTEMSCMHRGGSGVIGSRWHTRHWGYPVIGNCYVSTALSHMIFSVGKRLTQPSV